MCTVDNSWWWALKMPETSRVLWQNKCWIFDTSSWLFYTKLPPSYALKTKVVVFSGTFENLPEYKQPHSVTQQSSSLLGQFYSTAKQYPLLGIQLHIRYLNGKSLLMLRSYQSIEKNEMGGACSTYGGEERCIQGLVGKPGGKRSLGKPRRRRRII